MDKKRALFVDDNKVSQTVATALLNSLSLEVHTVDDGAEAILAIERHKYEIVFLDCLMFAPGHSETYSTLKQIQKHRGIDIPIIGMVSHSDPKSREQYLAFGLAGCIVKPIIREELEAYVRRVLHAQNDRPESIDQSSPSTTQQVLNINLLRTSFDEENSKDFLAFFAKTAAQEVEGISSVIAISDYFEAKKKLHSLKGSCATIYAEALAQSCLHLEEAIRQNNLEQTEVLIADLKAQLKSTLAHINNYLVKKT